MKVYVKIFKGKPFHIEVQPTDTVLDVKKQIQKTHGAQTYQSDLQELIYHGKVLKNETTIEENKVTENTILVLSMMLIERDFLESDSQNPHTGQFSSLDLKWSKVVGQNIDNVALIPHSRVKDFVKGEGILAGCKFVVSSTHPKKEGSTCKKRVDNSIEYTVYKCPYGPDDYREGGDTRKSRKRKSQVDKKCSGRPSKMIGCGCKFTVKRKLSQPNVAMIVYNSQRHVNKSGSTCHGLPMWVCKRRRTAIGGELKGE